jgi:hypothetical protein
MNFKQFSKKINKDFDRIYKQKRGNMGTGYTNKELNGISKINKDIPSEKIGKLDLKEHCDKLPMSSMQWKAFTGDRGVAGIFRYAMRKYGNISSWMNRSEGSIDRYESAMLRHYAKIKNGEQIDPESGLNHWAAIAWNVLTVLTFIIEDEEEEEEV